MKVTLDLTPEECQSAITAFHDKYSEIYSRAYKVMAKIQHSGDRYEHRAKALEAEERVYLTLSDKLKIAWEKAKGEHPCS